MKLLEIAALMKARKIPKKLLSLEDVYTFAQDRENRSIRFVRIVVAYRNGDKVYDIAEEYSCNPSTILRYARMAGIKPRDRFYPRTIKADVIRQLRAKLPLKTISTNVGVSEAYISKVAKEVGLNRYKRGLTRAQIRGTMRV